MRKEDIKILVACEESQAICIALRELGFEAYSCDVLECSGGHPEWHIQKDIFYILNCDEFKTCDGKTHYVENWNMIIGHPPCTYLSNAGAMHLYKGGKLNQERYEKGLAAKEFFMKLLNANCEYVCIENPTPSKIYGLPKHTQVIQPYEHGHPFQKRTLLWLKGLPLLKPTNIVEEREPTTKVGNWFNKCGSGLDRQRARSKTFLGIAKAMATQWGVFLESKLSD